MMMDVFYLVLGRVTKHFGRFVYFNSAPRLLRSFGIMLHFIFYCLWTCC